MGPIINQSGDVVLGHLGQLLLEDALEASEDHEVFSRAIIVDDTKFDITSALFQDGRFLGIRHPFDGLRVQRRGGSRRGLDALGGASNMGLAVGLSLCDCEAEDQFWGSH